jgi:hygromycin-B 4-O-kinase
MTRGAPFDPVTETQANAFLSEKFGDKSLTPVRPIGEGEWSKAYAYDLANAPYIIRFSNISEDFEKDFFATRFASPHLPVPKITELGEAYGGFYAISDRASGVYLDSLDATQMESTLPSLVRAVDAMRLADVSSTTGYGGWNPERGGNGGRPSWHENLLAGSGEWMRGWHTQLASSPVGLRPYEEALEARRSLVHFCPEERHLIHADLLHFNVLVTGSQISAVIDWGCSQYGDFLYDVAWLLFWQSFFPAWNDIDFLVAFKSHYTSLNLTIPHLEERLLCYQLDIGLDGLRWSAYKENWSDLEATAQRLQSLPQP